MPYTALQKAVGQLYERYNRPEFVHPDPLEFVRRYAEAGDREVAAVIASALAYGRVKQILRSAGQVLDAMGPRPRGLLLKTPRARLVETFGGFRHRFAGGAELSALLWGMRGAIEEFGSLEDCFAAGLRPEHVTVFPALSAFVGELSRRSGRACGQLLPNPARGSACKRLNLMLRWMVRRDRVDPGGWDSVCPSKLVVPLDTHMHRLSLALGLTRRRQADALTALEVTAAFRRISPEDPVRYDFALTRLGIRPDGDMAGFLRRCGVRQVGCDA